MDKNNIFPANSYEPDEQIVTEDEKVVMEAAQKAENKIFEEGGTLRGEEDFSFSLSGAENNKNEEEICAAESTQELPISFAEKIPEQKEEQDVAWPQAPQRNVFIPPAYHSEQQTVSQPVQQPVQQSVQQPVQQPVQQSVQQPVSNPYQAQVSQQNQPVTSYPSAGYNPYVAQSANERYTSNPYQRMPYAPGNMPPVQNNGYQQNENNNGKLLMIVVIAICAVCALVFLAIGLTGSGNVIDETTTQPVDSSSSNTTQPTSQNSVVNSELSNELTEDSMNMSTTEQSDEIPNSVYVAEKVRPSVVGVMTYMNGELYGEGSGVLMSEKGEWTYIVTCAHVISEEGVDYGVLLLDGTHLEAEMVTYDVRTDIGVIKVKETGLPLAEFGDSSTLKVGEPIYAIGNPGGSEYFGSITDGIVASIDRSISSTYTMTCIQHNAAINPGNSGGALVNSAGQVIGINSAKIASTEFEGMGFAVPTSIAGPIVDSLINYGYVPNRPKLGIEYAPVSSYQLYSIIVSINDLPQGSLVIASIAEDSALAGKDVEVGDLIIGVNGQDMNDSSVLLDLIETGAVGDELTLTICRINNRSYKISTFDVTVSLVEDKG